MDFKQFLQMARSTGTMPRIQIEGGQTDGHFKVEYKREKQCYKRLHRADLGMDYAKECNKADKEEERQEVEELISSGGFGDVDDLTSVGTYLNAQDPLNEKMTQVYDQYSFDKKPNSNLHISEYKDLIMEHIDQNPVIIIKGQTGCGKSTQVPQYILDSCRNSNIHCKIVVTQPRRIAATSVAQRVCDERGWKIGGLVGYQIAMDRQISDDTRLLYCTAGVLLQTIVRSKDLGGYTHIIIDEVHERDNETDFLLIVLKKLLRANGNRTKLILMSATINTDKFADYFTKLVRNIRVEPPIIELDQKTLYPVSYYYLDSLASRVPVQIPPLESSEPLISPAMYQLALILIEVFYKIDIQEHTTSIFLGSVLVFLPGIQEIETMYELLDKKRNQDENKREEWMICPLHSSVTFEEQIKVFKLPPRGYRKIILATNIAESSITVPDVKYVIDFCLMKLAIQEKDTNYSSLQLSWISKSQGSQRAGRVGRVMPGRVYRLVTEGLYKEFDDDCTPEILRCPLDMLVLKAKELNMGSPKSILGRAMDPPDLGNIQRTVLNLKEMGALRLTSNGVYEEDDGDLTFIGKVMAALPLDTHLSKLIIYGHMFSCLSECVVMACAMAVKSVFSTPFKQQLDAYNSKLSWADTSCSDPIAYYAAYSLWRHKSTLGFFKRTGGMSEKQWGAKYFIQIRSMAEIAKLEAEILSRLQRLGITAVKGPARVEWTNPEKSLILKIVLAAAAYPNFFGKTLIDEKEAVKTLGGRDPFSTIYLSNFPAHQPGPLYIESIKKHFLHCGSNINISFDGSFKVYLRFGSSQRPQDDPFETNVPGKIFDLPGKIPMAVYRAIKLRHLQIPITIPLLSIPEAQKRASEIFGDISPNVFCWNKKKEAQKKNNWLPGLGISILPVSMTHIESPGQFWVHMNNESFAQKHIWINSQIHQEGFKVPIKRENVIPGKICIAPYTDECTQHYRAKIINVSRTHSNYAAQVFFIDYGNTEIVRVNTLYDFSDEAIRIGLRDEPALALECRLAEVQPNVTHNPRSVWTNEATTSLKNFFSNQQAIAKIYSVVNGVMSVYLHPSYSTEKTSELDPENSFNHFLIKGGLGEPAEEPYLSRENQLQRMEALKRPEGMTSYPVTFPSEEVFAKVSFDPPSERECKTKVVLKGPKSPLEMTLFCLTRKSQGKEVLVEWNSVNSVLLDPFPMDVHDRLLVASTVTQSCTSQRLTLRNTTMMPNIHGLMALLSMIFAPRIELRTDPDRREYTGAICGLGYDEETHESYNPENDIEITFDTKFDLIDLENINKLRFWMNYLIGDETDFTQKDVIMSQQKIKEYIIALIGKRRESKPPIRHENTYEWGIIPEEHIIAPQELDSNSILPLILAIELKEGTEVSKVKAMTEHLDRLKAYSEGMELMKGGVKCELCQVYLDRMQPLKLHLHSALHKNNLESFTSSY